VTVEDTGCAAAQQHDVWLEKKPKPDRYFGQVMAERLEEFRFGELPEPMRKLRGVHPRLFLSAQRIEEIRRKIESDPYYAWMMDKVRHVADVAVRVGPPQYSENRGWASEEQTWQRQTGNLIAYLAFCYAISGDQKYLDATIAFIRRSMEYASWGRGAFAGSDLATGHQIFGIALAYDWLYHDLDEQMRRQMRELLLQRGRYMFDLFATGRIFWHDEYLQNHQWVNMTALTTAGLALYDEVDGLDAWILLPLEKIKVTMSSLGPDGASHEGVSYWSYGTEYLMKFMDLARDLLGVDFYRGNAWFANTAYYRLYSNLPIRRISRWGIMLSFGDSGRRDTYGPDYHLRKLAREYRIGHAQWLADQLDKANLTTRKASWLNLLWYDPTVEPTPPDDLPTFKHFQDMGLVFMRSDWSGDETLSIFKCGPHLGHHGVRKFSYDPGGSHAHPDAGTLQIYAHGEWLLIDDGYTYKDTKLQNTVLIDGIGQYGEDMPWFRGHELCRQNRGARILRAEGGQTFDYVIGDPAPAYKDEAHLRKFLRHVLYLKPDAWVIVDELETADPATFEVFFHTQSPFERVGGRFVCNVHDVSLTLQPLWPGEAVARTIKQKRRHPDAKRPIRDIDALVLSNAAESDRAMFVTYLEARPAGSAGGADVRFERTRDDVFELSVRSPQRTWRFRVTPGRADPAEPIFEPIE